MTRQDNHPTTPTVQHGPTNTQIAERVGGLSLGASIALAIGTAMGAYITGPGAPFYNGVFIA